MARSSVSFRHFILGLLTKRSMSGYDIRRLLRSLGWLLGNPSFGTIYPALHALLEDGLVTVEVVPHPSRPPRKIYTITEAGRQTLQNWVAQPPPSSTGLRAFIMHLILAGDSTSDGLIGHLRQRQDAVAAHRSALEQAVEGLGEQASAGELVAIEYGLAIANAELTWLEGKLDQLSTETGIGPSEEAT
jgi:DNA-binding PadR family transcriptional regulator